MSDLSTRLIHHPYRPPEGFDAPQAGVFRASTIFFSSVAAMRERYSSKTPGYSYGLHGTPTSHLLEARLCELEGGTQCLLAPSGLAAIALVNLCLLKSGDEVLLPDNVYGPSKALAEGELAKMGVTHRLYDASSTQDLAGKMSPKTALVWAEAPGSVTMEFPDLPDIVRLCRSRGVVCALDNTWGAGLAFAPFDLGDGLGVDVSVHALTKYPSGGGDVLMGSVITRDPALHNRLQMVRRRLGIGVGMNDVETVLRSLPSTALRYRAHDVCARALARWCAGCPKLCRFCIQRWPDRQGTHIGRRCAAARQTRGPIQALPPAFSASFSTRATAKAKSMPFAMDSSCFAWVTAGAGQSVWWCPTK